MFFLRKPKLDTEPLAIKMSGIRLGERLLQINVEDAKLMAAMAVKIGLSGTTAAFVADDAAAERARSAAQRAGALVDVRTGRFDALAFDADAFDVVVVHGVGGLLQTARTQGRADALLREARRVLRHGGRIIAIEAGPRTGIAGLLKPHRPDAEYAAAGGAVHLLQAAGFRPVRVLAERDGFTFTEGLKS
jgi:SAM-dependent methyltransferase